MQREYSRLVKLFRSVNALELWPATDSAPQFKASGSSDRQTAGVQGSGLQHDVLNLGSTRWHHST